jgi:predicted transcriptional regulator
MADYLFIDRSAMLREMKKMREEELIESKGKKIKLLRHGQTY